ncbi:MAG TPA: helicase-related protein [Geminicoccus sp.]|jgi:ATP-dependent RNA helicase SUPV3L1/SUV3|uniref:helicase-related protein n=1 Tax=Geminicoccus sp. TaxID=2024832 RepID=UPI002E2FB7F5|nr:helicase-related protein [Geminicoccus sp.]HEX2529312.1 helicase-related protein [Geminicoccus sp.]
MSSMRPSDSRILAVLGPTNTGKTHFAIERILAHRSGMIGLPLRLLAREIYDRIVKARGPEAVQLVTGEEKIGSDKAAYVVATVEAMPMDRPVGCLAVDEIQLCADWERGHVFTDRLLNARGLHETIFLGSDTMKPIIKRLIPDAVLIARPRLSTLTYAGESKLHRLPRRSAVVAFTAADVYALGEVIRRQRGGAAIVMGSLSPRTRNAQVAMYQAGEVDYLVATDAIGMGLNMDLTHVAFAALQKFDGRERRQLTVTEVAQIAGRAGRHMADGTFGTTNGVGELDERIVEAVESHSFPPLKHIRWRNSDLDFRSLQGLIRSLDAEPADPATRGALLKVRDALDDRSLHMLAAREEIRGIADRQDRVRLLWSVCQTPDFSKTLADSHLHLLSTIYRHLTGPEGVIPGDWVARTIDHIDRMDGDIDTLMGRLAHIRTWTYLSHRSDWFTDSTHWQERARAVEDRLSDALHERLMQRFVDKRTTALLRSLREHDDLPATVEPDGSLAVDGHHVGVIDGLDFTPIAGEADLARKALSAAARRALRPALERRVAEMLAAPVEDVRFESDGTVRWRGSVVGTLLPGGSPLRPSVRPKVSEELRGDLRERVTAELGQRLEAFIAHGLGKLNRLASASNDPALSGAVRGVAYALVEGMGAIRLDKVESLSGPLNETDRKALARLGVRLGVEWLYLPDLMRPRARLVIATLAKVWTGRPCPLPPEGATTWRDLPELSGQTLAALGFARFGDLGLRLDVTERLAAQLRARGRESRLFDLPGDLAAAAGLKLEELITVAAGLGFACVVEGEARRLVRMRKRRRPDPVERKRAAQAGRADSPFAVLRTLVAGSS